jgi:hypothetical protein
VPVHSYYIKAKQYFKKLSDRTGGECQKFNVKENDASEKLTNFMSMIILKNL